MDEARAKSNLCRIFHRQSDGGKKVFGFGSLVKCSDQTLKIATSKKVRKLMGGEVFASFETLPDKEVKLQVDKEEEVEDTGIAYVSFDEAAIGHRPEGISMRDIRGIEEIACRVPVLENLELLLGTPTSEIKLYDVERDHKRYTLKIQAGRNNRVINNLRESDNFHLLVRGAPILGADNFEFFGIVDFVEMGEESLLELVYYRGFPMASTVIRNQPVMHPSTPTHERGPQKPTAEAALPGLPTPPTGPSRDKQKEITDGGRNCLSPDNDLRRLWNYIDFRDEFSIVLDVRYARSKYWLHLAEQFGIIKQDIYNAFSTSNINSPTETLLKYLEATKPTYSVKEFCEDCKKADAHEVSRILEDSVGDGILDNEDLVSEIYDKADTKAPNVLDEVVLKLDRENKLWQNLASIREIPKEKYMAFQRDTTTNPARLFFNVLRTQGPKITVGDLRGKANQLKVEMISHILKKFKIPDEMLLKNLSRNSPGAKSEIESFLNDLTTDFLWNLAFLYQKEGLMEDIDLEMVFRQQEQVHSPTKEVMEHILARSPQRLTIKDLIVKLWNINRKDCFDILLPYLRGGKEDIDKITEGLGRLRVEPSDGRGLRPSTDEERPSNIQHPSDKSDETDNPYTLPQTVSKKIYQ